MRGYHHVPQGGQGQGHFEMEEHIAAEVLGLGPSHEVKPAALAVQSCCCLMLLATACVQGFYVFGRDWHCDAVLDYNVTRWDHLLPKQTRSQYKWGFFSNEISEFEPGSRDEEDNRHDEKRLGRWTKFDFLGLFPRYGLQDPDGKLLMQASEPWLYPPWQLGYRYHLWRCDGVSPDFVIAEDYWSEPWFSYGTQQIFNIIDVRTLEVAAKVRQVSDGTGAAPTQVFLNSSQRGSDAAWRSSAAWHLVVTRGPHLVNATVVAEARQQPTQPAKNWWRHGDYPWWHVTNHDGTVPNEILSFVTAVYDFSYIGGHYWESFLPMRLFVLAMWLCVICAA